jgi:hypothetical protein
LASPYTIKGYSTGSKEEEDALEQNYIKACAGAAVLQIRYQDTHVIFSPIAHSHSIQRYMPSELNNFDFWVKKIDDFIIRDLMDEVWVLAIDGWDKSMGVRHEMRLAMSLRKRVRLVDPEGLTFIKDLNIRHIYTMEWKESIENVKPVS